MIDFERLMNRSIEIKLRRSQLTVGVVWV